MLEVDLFAFWKCIMINYFLLSGLQLFFILSQPSITCWFVEIQNFFLEVLTVFQSLSNLALFFNDISMWEISPLKSPLKTSKLICAKLWSIQMQMSENDRFDTFEAFQTSFTLIHNQNHCHLENIKFYLLTFRQQVSGKLAGSVQ